METVQALEASLERPQSVGEEIANSVSHGMGLLAFLTAVPFLILHDVRYHSVRMVVGSCVFGATLLALYLTSTLYHALPRGRAKDIFQLIEHGAIFFLIAGTYTPFTLGVLHGPLGWTLLGLIWSFTAAGVILKIVGGVRYIGFSTLLYVAMGWLLMIGIRPLWLRIPHVGFELILFGGLAYTAGVAFYLIDVRMRYSHFVWHLFVLAGSILHFFAVWGYAAP